VTIKNGIIYPGATFVLTEFFYNSTTGLGVDPDTVQLLTLDPTGLKATYTYGVDVDVLERTGLGTFIAYVVPDKSGRWHYRWLSTNPVFADEGSFNVRASPFVDRWDCPPGWGYWY
jgi:hypothetical protein